MTAGSEGPGEPGDAGATTRPAVSLEGPLEEAEFVARPNRFVVRCRVDGTVEDAHLPDPGRLEELLVPGRRVLLRPAARPGRKTGWTAALVETPGGDAWVSVDTTLPNRLVGEALRSGALEEVSGWSVEGREVTLGDSRLDFLLGRPGGERLALEVKSVTLVVDREGRFPDAVTARGTRHVRELASLAAREGWHAAVLFVAQRADVDRVVADPGIDPDFAGALEEARAVGVEAWARRCRVTRERVEMGAAVPVG